MTPFWEILSFDTKQSEKKQNRGFENNPHSIQTKPNLTISEVLNFRDQIQISDYYQKILME